MENLNESPMDRLRPLFKKVEIFNGLVALIGLLLWVLQLPMASMLMVIGLMTFSSTNTVGIFFRDPDAKTSIARSTPKMIGIGCGLVSTGMLFKLQFYPAQDELFYVGLSLLLIALCLLGFNKTLIINYLSIKMFVVLLLGTFIWQVNSKTLFAHHFANDPEFVKLYENMIDNPTDKNAKEIFEKRKIEKMGQVSK
ncbi:MAG: hypothetical protein EAZ97_02485 [Bacteroidetes bacterium]|nr:MAG: hypothetical protein EAZ97_02485 [Bacteroidota bacterium]